MIVPKFLPDEPVKPSRRIKATRESDIEKYLVKQVKALGGEVRKVKWIGRDKAPDRLVMLPESFLPGTRKIVHEGRTIWFELKAPGLAATFPKTAHEKAQHREHERMRKMGQHVVVIDSIEGVDEVLK